MECECPERSSRLQLRLESCKDKSRRYLAVAEAMTDLVDLLAATEKSLQTVATEIERLGKNTEQKEEKYINAAGEEKTAFKNIWEAAVR